MADITSKVLLDVEINATDPIKNIAELKENVSKLKDEQKQLKEAGEENSESYVVLGEQIKALNSEIAKNSREVQSNIKEATNAAGSYNALSAQLAKLKAAYKAAGTDEERAAILKNLTAVDDQLKKMDEAQGVYVRNVGNYTESILKAVGPIGTLISTVKKFAVAATATGGTVSASLAAVSAGIKAMTSSAMKFLATPIGAVIGAIGVAVTALVSVFKKLSDAFKKNDEAATNLARFFDIFKPIVNGLSAAFDWLASAVGSVAGWFADLFGGASDGVKAMQELTTATDNLEEAERNYTVNSAKRNRDVAELQDKAYDKEKYTAEERKKFLEQANQLEEKNLADQKAIAAEKLRILEATAKAESDTSDETKNKIAEARAAMYKAEEDYYNGKKSLTKKINSLEQEIQREAEEAAKEEEQKKKERADRYKQQQQERLKNLEEQATKEKELRRQVEDMAISFIEDNDERQRAQLQKRTEREIEDLQLRLEKEKNLTGEARESINQLIIDKRKKLENELQAIDEAAAKREEDNAKSEEARLKEEEKQAIELEKRKADAREKFGLISVTAQQKEMAQLQSLYDQKLLSEEEFQKAKALIEEKYRNMEAAAEAAASQEASQAKIASIEQYAQAAAQVASSLSQMMSNIEQGQLEEYEADNEKKKESLQKRLDQGLISQEEYDASVAKLDEELDKKQKEIARKQAIRQKAFAIMEAVVNTALGIAKAVSESPMTGGLPGSAIMAATGAAQIAAIAAEPIPKASKGMLLQGPSHAQGGIPIEAEGGEAIINKKATKRFLPLLSRINQSTGGVALYGKGGTVGMAEVNSAELIDYGALAQACAQMNVQVAVRDINDGQGNFAKVENLRTF